MTEASTPALRRGAAFMLILVVLLGLLPSTSLCIAVEEDSQSTAEPVLDDRLADDVFSEKQVDVLVKYDSRLSEIKAREAISRADRLAEFVEVFKDLSLIRVRMIGTALPRLLREDGIADVWSNEINELNPEQQATPALADDYQPIVDVLDVRNLWQQGFNGSGTVIAVLDTGVDFLHPDLDDFDDNSSTLDPKVTAFASFVEADTLPVDIIGHGTYAASLAAGTGARSDGLYAGIAPGATLIAAKVTLGGVLAAPSWIVSGIEWACSRGADIILMPFNTYGAPTDAVAQAVELAAEKGVLVIAAAGDDGPDYLTIMSPGGSTRALTVGAYDTSRNVVPAFSGRGPTFEMMAKPDLVAPGVGLVGAKASLGLVSAGFGSFDLSSLGSISGLLGGSLGESVDENYIVADTTAASAAIVAGAAAILMQAFDRATPIVICNVLRNTAIELPYGANDAGAGLLNLKEAFAYLSRQQDPVAGLNRTTGIPLLALGLVSSQGASANTTVLVSSFGTMTAAVDQRGAEDSGLHLLLGMLSMKWNNMDPTNLMMFEVKRELHQVYAGQGLDNYNRYVGVLSYDDKIYVALLIEAYNTNNPLAVPVSTGFKMTPYVINLGDTTIDNLSLYLAYSLDIYADGNDDHGKYALENEMLFAYGLSETLGDFYFGLNSSIPLAAFEVGNSSDVGSHVAEDNLTGATTFDGTVGLGMKWTLGSVAPLETSDLTLSIGFAENRTVLNKMIDTLWELAPSPQFQQLGDLIVVEADIPRTATAGAEYESRTVVMNVGAASSPLIAALIVARSVADGGTVHASYTSFAEVEPFGARVVTAKWRPEANGIYSAAWVVASGIQQALALFGNPTSALASSSYSLLDDFLLRDLFIVTPIRSASVFPKHLPFAPFNTMFPADFGIYGLMLYSTISLGNLTAYSYGNASDWGDITLTPADSVEGYYNFSLFIMVPPIVMNGHYRCDYRLVTTYGYDTNITLRTDIVYPRAMILLDTSHSGGIFGGSLDTGSIGGLTGTTNMSFPLAQDGGSGSGTGMDLTSINLSDVGSLVDMIESLRLTTFSGLSDMKKTMAECGLDLIEIPGIGLTESLLSQFSAVIVISPTEEYNSTEIQTLRNFSQGGGRLVILGDYDDRTNLTGLNPLLTAYGYEMRGKHTAENTTEIVQSSKLGTGIDSVWLGGGTYIYNNQSNAAVLVTGVPVVLLDESPPKIALFGSSRIFMNKNLPKCNNSRLLDNLNLFLLENTLQGVTGLSENTTLYPLGKSVYLNLWVTDFAGGPVDNLFVAIAFHLPNGSLAYFFAAAVGNGLYSSQFLPAYCHEPGRVDGIFIIVKSEDYAGTFASVSFNLYLPATSTTTEVSGRILSMPQIAFISSVSVFGAFIIGIVWNKRRQGKRLRIPDVDTTLTQDIDNTMNRFLAAFVQIEGVIKSDELDRVQKVESLRAMMNLLEDAKKDFEKLSEKVGGV